MIRSIRTTLPIILMAILCLSFTYENTVEKCCISFDTATDLTTATPDRLPETAEKTRTLKTDTGVATISRIDGYRILYYNTKNVPFINLKIELSEKESYNSDQEKIIANLRYLNSHSQGMETRDLIELHFNGYKIYGLSRGTIEEGSILGTFVAFPGDGVVIYFYFNNLKPGYRDFESVADYKKQRDQFIEEYTKHLKTCSN